MNTRHFANCDLRNLLLPLILLAALTLGREARADSMTLSETWVDTSTVVQGNAVINSTDNGTFSASLTVPGLQNFTATTWSNLLITLVTSNLNTGAFSDIMSDASPNTGYGPGSAVTATSATFFIQTADTNGIQTNAFKLVFSRSGNTLTISGQTQSPVSLPFPWSIAAENYLYTPGATNDPYDCEVLLQSDDETVQYADIIRILSVTAKNNITEDSQGNPLNNITVSGSADFTPPTITAVSPSGSSLTTTNGLLPVIVKATDASGVANVEFFLNGQDFGAGDLGSSNLWSQNLALFPGTNTIRTVATDNQGNISTNSLAVTYVNNQTNVTLVTLSEHWVDTYYPNSVESDSVKSLKPDGLSPSFLTQNAGILDAALPVSALQTMTATTWSNLNFSINFGDFDFSDSLTNANTLTTNTAVFQWFTVDLLNNPVLDIQLALTRVGGKLLVAAETVNPPYSSETDFIAGYYTGDAGSIEDQEPFSLQLADGNTSQNYLNYNRTIYITGTNTITVSNTVPLNNIQITGAADYIPPVLTNVSPATGTLNTTNGLLKVTLGATDANGVTNVEFYLNGVDFGSGLTVISNDWFQSLAFMPGSNTVKTVATDPSGNLATNILQVNYVNSQTNASLISFSEEWLGAMVSAPSSYADVKQDAVVINAALPVPALQTMTATTWSNLVISLAFGNYQFTTSLTNAIKITTNSATVPITTTNDSFGNSVALEQLTLTRVGAKLILDATRVTPLYISQPAILSGSNPLFPDAGPVNEQSVIAISLVDGNTSAQYLDLNRTVYVAGTNAISVLGWTSYDDLQISGAADFIPPTNQITAPIAAQQWSNSTFTVTGKATDDRAVSNVLYSLNGSDWTSASNLNNWSNWTAQASLIPGSNTVSAYAVDYDNNYSTTSTVSFRYIVSGMIAISTNGLGTLSPNYSGALLAISNTYSITATPASGFIFTNWTGSVFTNGATLKFLMLSNLSFTANFIDVTRPTISVTNLAPRQVVSNASFTVMGKAADNWQVTNVLYQFNNGGWSNALTGNNWTNWYVPLSLIPGTNNFQAYALDQAGNASFTTNISFDYILSSELRIASAGVGTLSPNYSNAMLAIGQSYTITATPASGFVLTNWTIATNFIGGQTVTNTTLQFTMASNLTLFADFVDVTRPTVTIKTPTANQRLTNAIAYVTGTASDNWRVTGVWYQFNSAAWTIAPTTNGWTNWNTTLTLPFGTNTLSAYALDLGGNYSLTSNVSFYSSNTFQLQLVFATNTPLATNGLNLDLLVSTNLRGHIQYSTNLLAWNTLTNFNGTNSTLKFIDTGATNAARRFYRAIIP